MAAEQFTRAAKNPSATVACCDHCTDSHRIADRSTGIANAVSHCVMRKTLLVCGVASSLLYALMIWGIRYEGYSPISQVPSELTAIGAPTQGLWARLGWIYTVLITAFGIGAWQSAGGIVPSESSVVSSWRTHFSGSCDRSPRCTNATCLPPAEARRATRCTRSWPP